MPMTSHLKARLLNSALRGAAFTAIPTVTMSLHTANPTDDGSVGEASGGGYARQTVTFVAPTGTTSMSVALAANAVFTNMPAGTFTHLALWDGSSCIWSAQLSVSKSPGSGDELRITEPATTFGLSDPA